MNEFSYRLENLSRRMPKERIVLFFGREYFSDNTKYLYLQALEQQAGFRCIWCSCQPELIGQLQEKNLPCHLMTDDTESDTLRLFLSAAVAVFSVNPSQSLNGSEALFASLQGARHIQLWHGVSVKHLLLDLATHLDLADYHFRRPLDFASRADCVLSPAASLDAAFQRFFGCRRLIRAGYPRNEVLLRPATAHERIGSELPAAMLADLRSGQHKKVLFAPTWQRGENGIVTGSTDFLLALAKRCHAHGASLFIKSHPLRMNNEASRRLAERCFYINPSVDIYPCLNQFDLLITDYSSIMFDFLLTQKPVMRLDITQQSHLTFEPDYSLVPEVEFAYSFDRDTLDAVFARALTQDDMQPQRKMMADKLFETDSGSASATLLALLAREVRDVVEQSRAFSVE